MSVRVCFETMACLRTEPYGAMRSHRVKLSGARGLRAVALVTCSLLLPTGQSFSQNLAGPSVDQTRNPVAAPQTLLGPDDQVAIRALNMDEIDNKLARVDLDGYVDVPLLGKVKAAGLTVDQLETEVTSGLQRYVREPKISITVVEYRSKPVSVLGAVNAPGVYGLTGPTTLIQALSKAGGLRTDAGNTIEITRRSAAGLLPLPSARSDASGQFSTAEVRVNSLLEAKDPQQNILIMPNDVISVPRASLVYVAGAVRKPGGFVLNERDNMTVLQAVSMAEGMEKTAAPSRAKIIRNGTTDARAEIPVDVSKIVSGKSPDVTLLANDILVVPTSGAKAAFYRGVEAAIQAGVGVAIYHP